MYPGPRLRARQPPGGPVAPGIPPKPSFPSRPRGTRRRQSSSFVREHRFPGVLRTQQQGAPGVTAAPTLTGGAMRRTPEGRRRLGDRRAGERLDARHPTRCGRRFGQPFAPSACPGHGATPGGTGTRTPTARSAGGATQRARTSVAYSSRFVRVLPSWPVTWRSWT